VFDEKSRVKNSVDTVPLALEYLHKCASIFVVGLGYEEGNPYGVVLR
jgi:hypothetical protein